MFSLREYRQRKRQHQIAMLKQWNCIAEDCSRANQTLADILSLNSYVHRQCKQEWISTAIPLREKIINTPHCKRVSPQKRQAVSLFLAHCAAIDQQFREHNREIAAREKQTYPALTSIEGKDLNTQQWECIVNNELNQLAVAGPGCGKTTTIIGKVKYLLNRHCFQPNEILVISISDTSASKLQKRIGAETGCAIKVMTLEELALEITQGRMSPSTVNLPQFILEQLRALTEQPQYQELLSAYFMSCRKPYRSPFQFRTQAEYSDYLEESQIVTLKGEKVKSYEEMEIANFLYTNNIDYVYENQYRPRLNLQKCGVCIQHTAMDKDGTVPTFSSWEDTNSANKHTNITRACQENSPVLQTYSYEMLDGTLVENLKERLRQLKINLQPMSGNELWQTVRASASPGSLTPLFTEFISQLRANNLSIQAVREKNQRRYTGYYQRRNELLLSLMEPIYTAYTARLRQSNQHDFSHILCQAAEIVLREDTEAQSKYIIVDDFQDMSLPRYKLLAALKEKSKARLFCLGDDWQSIRRSGSDHSFLTDFTACFGYTERSYLETSYTLPSSIIQLSSTFILKNRSQIRKELRSADTNQNRAFELVYGTSVSLDKQLKLKLDSLPRSSTVLLMGRYQEDLRDYEDSQLIRSNSDYSKVTYSQRQDLSIRFSTIHDSINHTADYVFLLNNQKGQFPNAVTHDPVLNLVLRQAEKFPYAEERRLFYVALTRAAKYVYLMVNKDNKSVFIQELEEDYPAKTTNQKQEDSLPEYMIQKQNRFGFSSCARNPKVF